MANTNTKPLPHTFLTTDRSLDFIPAVYYQNTNNRLCILYPSGKAEVVGDQKPIIPKSPLACTDFRRPIPLIWPPPPRVVLGKDHQHSIISIIEASVANVNIQGTTPESKFATTDDGVTAYVHFQRPQKPHEILEEKLGLGEPQKPYVIVTNAAPAQPLAVTSALDGPRSKHSIDSAKAQDPAAAILPIGPTRYTVYHGNDGHLWFVETWGWWPTFPSKIENVTDIYPGTPLSFTAAPGRLVLHYLNSRARLCRISRFQDGSWGEPVVLNTPALLLGTNLAGTLQPINTFLHTTINVAYQAEDCSIKIFNDTFIWNDRE